MKEMKCKVRNAGAKLKLNGEVWSVVTCLFAGDTVLLAESEGDLQRVANDFYTVCKGRKFKVNSGKSKVMVFERRGEEVIDFIDSRLAQALDSRACSITDDRRHSNAMQAGREVGTEVERRGR